ncbi:hypothetical protein KUDE01_010109, partial [Dissostichus eleginoides]
MQPSPIPKWQRGNSRCHGDAYQYISWRLHKPATSNIAWTFYIIIIFRSHWGLIEGNRKEETGKKNVSLQSVSACTCVITQTDPCDDCPLYSHHFCDKPVHTPAQWEAIYLTRRTPRRRDGELTRSSVPGRRTERKREEKTGIDLGPTLAVARGHMEWSDRALESTGVTHTAVVWWGLSYRSRQH